MRIRYNRPSSIIVDDEDGFVVAEFFCRGNGLSGAVVAAEFLIAAAEEKPKRIMSGEYSRDMWMNINTAKTVEELRYALYFVCCRLQQLESRFSGRCNRGE